MTQTDRQRDTDRCRQIFGQTDLSTNRQRKTDIQTYRHIEGQTG